jgi:hypothetical protein
VSWMLCPPSAVDVDGAAWSAPVGFAAASVAVASDSRRGQAPRAK